MTSRRRRLLLALGLASLAPLCAAQQAPRMHRLGLFGFGSREATIRSFDPLLQLLAKSGFVVGKNLEVVYSIAASDSEPLGALATELAASRLNAILVTSVTGALALKRATQTTPVIALIGSDPVAEGLIASTARPGANITGVTILSIETGNKRVELLKEMFPATRRVYWLTNAANMRYIEQSKPHAKTLGMELVPLPVEGPQDLESFFARPMRKDEAIHVGTSQPNFVMCKQIVALANQARAPIVYPFPECAQAGGLVSYASDFGVAVVRSAALLVQVLKGANPAEIPFEQAMHVNTVVNLKTARALGITVPRSVLIRAAQVIE